MITDVLKLETREQRVSELCNALCEDVLTLVDGIHGEERLALISIAADALSDACAKVRNLLRAPK